MVLTHLQTAFIVVLFAMSSAMKCNFGPKCKQKCPHQCLNLAIGLDTSQETPQQDETSPVCHPTTGVCLRGCQKGWYGKQCQSKCINCKGNFCLQTGPCVHGCIDGFHGYNCTDRCSSNCVYQSCHHNGTCIYGCMNRYYGDGCELSCGDNCLNQRCFTSPSLGTYECSDGCKDGWKGKTCQQKCPVHCISCHFQAEGCTSCESGWSGSKCNRPVLDQCKTSMTQGGNCSGGCHDGFRGSRCELKCPDFCLRCEQDGNRCTVCHPGRYGVSCDTFCTNCEQGLCNITTGDCTLGNENELPDMCHQHAVIHYYNSSHCARHKRQKRHIVDCFNHCRDDDCTVCDLGWFGSQCEEFCPENCYNGCNITGECNGCLPDVYGAKCEKNCPVNCRPSAGGQVACDEVTGQCLSGCIPGWYGWTCNITCPTHCERNICTQTSGKCTTGCNEGWTWYERFKKCVRPVVLALLIGPIRNESAMTCQRMYYGDSCEQKCSSSCKESSCVFSEELNSVVCTGGCVAGQFGPYCEERCPAECETCEDGKHCSKCSPGYHGPVCSKSCSLDCIGCRCHQNGSCSEGCIPEHHGEDCRRHCGPNCLKCHQWTGQCLTCRTNWCGQTCDRPCFSCRHGICERKDGVCVLGCNPGLDGPLCNDTPHINTPECFKSEETSDTLRTKRHACEYGCLTSECSRCFDGFFGNTCEKMCPVNCEGTCSKEDGHCDYACKEGFWGSYCNISCPENCRTGCNQTSSQCYGGCKPKWHGFNCTEKCPERCDPDVCFRETGKCTTGCIDGWQGSTCHMPCSQGCKGNVCYIDGRCKNGCYQNFTGAFDKCLVPCSPNCVEKACNISKESDMYHCKKGCVDGYAGDFCNVKCPNNCLSCRRSNFLKCISCSCHHYGSECQHQCNGACLNTSCPVCDLSGSCRHGCVDGHWGNGCQHTCPEYCVTCMKNRCAQCKPGFYGLDCTSKCGHCVEKECYKGNGICISGCIRGYRGDTCDIPELEITSGTIVMFVVIILGLVLYCVYCMRLGAYTLFNMTRASHQQVHQ